MRCRSEADSIQTIRTRKQSSRCPRKWCNVSLAMGMPCDFNAAWNFSMLNSPPALPSRRRTSQRSDVTLRTS